MTPADLRCDACGYTCSLIETPNPEQLTSAARHEAGHAVMRWVRGYPLSPVCIHADGSGLCTGQTPGLMIRHADLLLVAVAGPLAEVGLINAFPWS